MPAWKIASFSLTCTSCERPGPNRLGYGKPQSLSKPAIRRVRIKRSTICSRISTMRGFGKRAGVFFSGFRSRKPPQKWNLCLRSDSIRLGYFLTPASRVALLGGIPSRLVGFILEAPAMKYALAVVLLFGCAKADAQHPVEGGGNQTDIGYICGSTACGGNRGGIRQRIGNRYFVQVGLFNIVQYQRDAAGGMSQTASQGGAMAGSNNKQKRRIFRRRR